DLSLAVHPVASEDLLQQLLSGTNLATRAQLLLAPLRSFGRRRGEEDLAVGLGQHDRADVASDHDNAAAAREIALLLEHRITHRGHARDLRDAAVHLSGADVPGDVGAVE